MSGYALIYDKSGVDPFCLLETYKQINNLIDDRSYQAKYFSEAPNAINDSESNPVRLFVIPGGNYTQMAEELKPLAPRIRQLITEDGASYLGICAGAIAATCRPVLMYMNRLNKDSNPMQEMIEVDALKELMHLQLYSGNCCIFDVPQSLLYGTQQVKKVSSEIEQQPYPLYFSRGVFFPSAATESNSSPLLEYASYKFSGFYGLKETYNNIAPIAAVTQKAGNGRLLLSGVHPEISSEVVAKFSTNFSFQEEVKLNTISSLRGSKTAQVDTMRDYLNTLSIATKV